jgi:hypothetical protein
MFQKLFLAVTFTAIPLVCTTLNNEQVLPTGSSASLKMAPLITGLQKSKPTTSDEPDINTLKQGSWYAEAMKQIQQKEYEFHKDDNTAATYVTPNRKNNLRFHYTENGFTVTPRTTKIPLGKISDTTRPDRIQYKELPDWSVAFHLDRQQIGEGQWTINGNKAEYHTDNITVQYLNNEEGMRQNFIVQRPLQQQQQELKLRFQVTTSLKQEFSSDQLRLNH